MRSLLCQVRAVSQVPRVKVGGQKGTAVRQSGFRGVRWDQSCTRWRAATSDPCSHRNICLGSFMDEETAARAYDCAAVLLRGMMATRNLPELTLSEDELNSMQSRLNKARSRKMSSQYRGVYFRGQSDNKWACQLRYNKKHLHIGQFRCEKDAAFAFDNALRANGPCRSMLLGSLNFPEDSDYFTEGTWLGETIPPARTSRFLGVSKEIQNIFRAQLGTKTIGRFATEIAAARAYDKASMAIGGSTNFNPKEYMTGCTPALASQHDSMTRTEAKHVSSDPASEPHVPSWISERHRQDLQKMTQAVAEARAKLKIGSGALFETRFESERDLWHTFCRSEKNSASKWQFLPNDIICIKAWTGRKLVRMLDVETQQEVKAEHLVARLLDSSRSAAAPTSLALKERACRKLVSRLSGIANTFMWPPACNVAWSLNSFSGNEAQSRMLIDAILVEVCTRLELHLALEEQLPACAPVAGVADYVLRRSGAVVAVVEAKRCVSSQQAEDGAWASLLADAVAQTLALLAGFSSAELAPGLHRTPLGRPLGLVTDARHWLLLDLPPSGPPVLQRWPHGALVLELTDPSKLGLLLWSLDMLWSQPKERKTLTKCYK
ncbi:unnamed protein product [Polarella glacialis]|uniref:AP2/ERF domain-containing protein n=1 Tax=Polarella glacialis TaxID=89957 RepID=A0A813GJ78_POLGL|nr:unnamed protein product [Polarella glacialis]